MTNTHPGLQYAANLGMQTVYDEAESARLELNSIVTDLDKAQDERRMLVELITDQEMVVLNSEWAKHSDMAVTRMEQHVKVAKRKDPILTDLRNRLNKTSALVYGLEYDRDMSIQTIRIRVARMEELGGYFNFLAALKQAETHTKPTIVTGEQV